jgi:23S rRNA (adenine2503-C2)-methyltransferase
MPINETNNIKALIDALNYFYEKTKNDITLEYILFKGVNDSMKDADDLVKIYKQIPCHLVNIIEYNPIDQASFEKPEKDATQKFMDYLANHRVNVRLRVSRGKDIDAACGQLANKALVNS